jgi:hypothetical protein
MRLSAGDFWTRNRGPIAVIFGSLVLVIGFLWLFYHTPGTRIGPEQPIPFSHRIHAGVKAISCEYCHPTVRYSRHPGLPAVEKCLHCHRYIIPDHFWIQEEHRYYRTGTPTPWKKVNELAEHVLFNHQRHIRKDIACRECHGFVETRDRLNHHRFTMGFCIDCHRRKQANLDCWLACHG